MAQQELDFTYYYNYLFLATVLLLPFFLLISMFKPREHGGENLPPGPWRLLVIGSMHHLVGALPHHAMRDIARRYNAPLMLLRLGELDVVVASSASAAKEIMKTHDAVFATRPRTATLRAITRDDLGITLTPHGEHWRRLRKLCVSELLSARQVRSLRGCREAKAAALVSSIVSSLSSSSEPVNIRSLLSTYVTDVAVHAVVGERNRELRDEFLKRLNEGVMLAAGFSLADMFPSSRLARAFSGSTRRLEAICHDMSRVIDHIIEDHRTRRSAGAGGEEEDIVAVLLRIQNDGSLHVPLDDGTIRAVITDLVSGGSETTATTLQRAMAELMRSPAALRRAQAEVRGAHIRESCVREEALKKLHYLHLVIKKEMLRLHPVVPFLIPRECLEPCRVLGYDVPKGAMVLVNAWAIGRDSASWGTDAKEFRPERFEEAGDAAVDFRGTNFELVLFGAGRRICPGITFGLAVVELMLASLLFHFDWELPGGGAGGLDMAEELGITARRKGDLWLHATVHVPAPNP
ncbi:premnaspirodiene oxygenase-like [Triticum dicoccoides]|uniref:premnaspirodiene oxygenase-like n=1 Tax=Triticum dicoccoides TaxID=85692 RepID=UPI001891B7E4|nr:premnaspirodiene oxygenase-like [Triticum dicoccoides]